jgi:hypothetical protein
MAKIGAPMKNLPSLLALAVSTTLAATSFAAGAGDIDPDAKAAVEAARKMAEKAGVQVPDLKKLMEDDEEEKTPAGKKGATATEKTAPAKAANTKPEPLKAPPAWVTPLAGFQQAPGGKRWVEGGVEKGEVTGTAPGAPRELAANWAKAAKESFYGVSTNDATINGALTITIFATHLRNADVDHRVELELQPGKGGKTSNVKLTYAIGTEDK